MKLEKNKIITIVIILMLVYSYTNHEKIISKKIKQFIVNYEIVNNKNISKIWLSSDLKDTILHRSFLTSIRDYNEELLNRFFKISYSPNDSVTIIKEENIQTFEWIKLKTPQKKYEIFNGKFPKKQELISENKNLSDFEIVIQFKMNLNKLIYKQIIETPKKLTTINLKVDIINKSVQEYINLDL